MIVHDYGNNAIVVFVRSPQSQYKDVLAHFKVLKKDGNPYKYVELNLSSKFNIPDGDYVDSVHIKIKSKNVHVVSDRMSVMYNGTSLNGLVDFLNGYGKRVDISINGSDDIHGGFYVSDGLLTNSDGETISIGQFSSGSDLKWIHQAIQRMTNDGGRLLFPVVKKFHDILSVVRTHHRDITGYFNMTRYMRSVKIPSNRPVDVSDGEDINSDYVINANRFPMHIELQVSGISNDRIKLNLTIDGSFENANAYQSPNPYLLVTTYPVKMGRDKLPSKIVTYGKKPFFISPLIFNSAKYLKGMKGGVDLLK